MLFNLIHNKDIYKNIKVSIWIYFFLLLFEGSIRKWIIPSLSGPLLIVRDPIAFIAIIQAFNLGILKINKYFIILPLIGILSFIASLFFGHGSISVGLYGLRPFLLHIPFAFVIGNVFNRQDVIKVGKVLIYMSILMIILTIAQFYSPQSAWINRGIGGDMEGSGFGGAMGFYRPSGTFSFINGLSGFYGITSAFIFYFLFYPNHINRTILILALFAAFLSIPFTISRTVLFQNLLCFLFSLMIIIKRPELFKTLFFSLVISLILVLLFINNDYVQTGINAFISRFDSASESEGGLKGTLIDRVFLTLWDGIASSTDISYFGKGLGANTNVGLSILGNQSEDRISDYEWVRTISEIGPVLGIFFIIIRLKIFIGAIKLSIHKIKNNDFLPWMLLSYGGMQIIQGQIAQPTSLGFITLIIGLIYACGKKQSSINKSEEYSVKLKN
jgi:hypothetical protein